MRARRQQSIGERVPAMTQHHEYQDQQQTPGERERAYAVSRRGFLRTAGTATAIGLAGAGAISWMILRDRNGIEQVTPVDALVAGFRPTVPLDPLDPAWASRPPVAVPLLPQQMATPMLEVQTVEQVWLRVLHDGNEIAFHLEWEDDDVNDVDAMGLFRDSVAVQLPVDAENGAPITMGGPGRPVHILHWKASWQREVLHGPRRLRDAFPYAVNELTPEDMMGIDQATVYYPARYVGNLHAALERTTPVEELVAEGFGTLTTHDEQRAQGEGLAIDGRWFIVIRLPMTGADRQASIRPGRATQVALAAWDGGHGNRGGRKHWSNWVPMDVEGTA
jgi:hypothetical protein